MSFATSRGNATRAYKEATRPFTNHPVCAAKERDLFIEAQPPLLEKEGNGLASTSFYSLQQLPLASTAFYTLNNFLLLQQFSNGQVILDGTGPETTRPWQPHSPGVHSWIQTTRPASASPYPAFRQRRRSRDWKSGRLPPAKRLPSTPG